MEGQPNQVQQVLVPVTRDRFSELSGIEINIVESMVRNRSLPVIKLGKEARRRVMDFSLTPRKDAGRLAFLPTFPRRY